MNILMIGNKDSGKTSYMASAFGVLQKRICGFSVQTESSNCEWFLKLYENLKLNKYPDPTDKRAEYYMDLYYYHSKVLSFCWRDYFGGIITDISQESKKLQDDIENAEGIMLFFDALALYKKDRTVSQVRRILHLIYEKIVNLDDCFSIIIVLTKYDLVSNLTSYNEICAVFNEFSNNIKQKENIYFRIAPVSCTQNGMINVELPLLDILHSGLYKEYVLKAYELKSIIESAQDYSNRVGFFDWTISRLVGVPTNGEIARAKIKEFEQKKVIFEQIEAPIEKLTEYIENYMIEIPGQVVGTRSSVGKENTKYNI